MTRHKKISTGHIVAATLASTTLMVDVAAAQQRQATLEEIVVTARKQQESLQDIPLSVTAVGGEAMREQMVTNMDDAALGMANVNFAVRIGAAVPTIRGVGFSILNSGTTANVAMHINGVYIGRPQAVASSFFDVERLEVVRGPQGTLYGRNATGGAINIVSRAPTEELSGYINTTMGNYNAFTVEGALSGTLIDDKLLGRIAIRSDRHDGWATNLATGNETDAQDLQSMRASFRYTPSDTLTIDWNTDIYQQNDSMFGMKLAGQVNPEFPLGGTLLGGEPFPLDSRDINTERDILNERDIWGTDVTATWVNGDYALKSITAYRETKVNVESDIDGTSVVVFSGPNREEIAEQFSQEFQLTYSSERIDWLAGAFYFYETIDVSNVARDGYSLPNGTAPFYPREGGEAILMFQNGATVDNTSYAVFGEGTYKFNEQWSATAGLRYTYEEVEIDNEFSPLPTSTRDCAQLDCDLDFDNLSPRVILKYTPNDDWMLFASVSDGFKSGGFSLGARAPAFNEEEIRSYEIGAKATLWNDRVQLSVTAFEYQYDDLQVTKVLDAVALTENAADASITGLEAELKALITDNLQVDVALGLLDAEFEDFESQNPSFPGTAPEDLAGNKLPLAPEATLNIGAEYAWQLGNAELTLRGEMVYSDEYYMTAFNQQPEYQDSYELYNLFLHYRHQNGITAGLYARNIGDELVRSSGYATIVSLGTPAWTSYLPPETYGVSLSYSF
jgi:iron complex outermembrane receptor protein